MELICLGQGSGGAGRGHGPALCGGPLLSRKQLCSDGCLGFLLLRPGSMSREIFQLQVSKKTPAGL